MTESSTLQASSPSQSAGIGDAVDAAADALKKGVASGVHTLSTDVKNVASDVAMEAKKAAETKLDAGKDFAAEQLGAVAGALRETSRKLRQGESGLTDYVEKAARSVDGVSTYLQTRTLSQLISDVEGYARREPAVFLGGAFFVGLLGGRFLKSATPAAASSSGTHSTSGSRAGGSHAAGALGQRDSKEDGGGAHAQGGKSKGQNGGAKKTSGTGSEGSGAVG
jgi:hypothetical protein